MTEKLTCIECPIGCTLSVDVENCKVVKVTGNKCPKGLFYASMEVEDPSRVLTSTVLAEGLNVRMVPVRTSEPIPKPSLLNAMEEVKRLKVSKPVKIGEVIASDFIKKGVNLIATRDVE